MASGLYSTLHAALRSAGSVDRRTAEATDAAVRRHETEGRLTADQARILRWLNWQAALNPFAGHDPDWVSALKPDDTRHGRD